nr:AzlD domain-containing protein [Tissierella sp.]
MRFLPLILGMAIVTYIPRLIPLFLLKRKNTSDRFRLFLTFIPYTSLSILLIRGILTAPEEIKAATIVGIITASFIAYIQNNLIFSVIGGIIAAFITINFLGA